MNPSQSNIVTRFAPSPTGALHVGGARTALFNWAYARHFHDSSNFVLRIEDTDQARSTDASTISIIEDLHWLGIDWDAGPNPTTTDPTNPKAEQVGDHGPYFQSQRLDIYQKYVQQLRAEGIAYKCFKTQDEIAQAKAQAREEGRSEKYDPTESMNLTPEQAAAYEAQGRASVLRFHMPNQDILIEDAVLGQVRVAATELEDFVIIKSDGFPTYHFAVVIDDQLMGVNHILRGQEHLNNTPKHVALQDALGFTRPTFAHIPLIFNTDSSKMSKRDKVKAARTAGKLWLKENNQTVEQLAQQANVDAEQLQRLLKKKSDDTAIAQAIAPIIGITLPEIDVADFRASGYLPQVLCNYLSRLGWSPKNDEEKFDNAFLCENFTLDRIGKSNSKFDRDKLMSFNADALREMNPQEFHQQWHNYCKTYRPDFLSTVSDEIFTLLAAAYQERSQTLAEPCELAKDLLISDDAIEYNAKAVKKNLAKNENAGYTQLGKLSSLLKGIDTWDSPTLDETLKAYMTEHELGMGQVFQPLRIAVTGNTVSPPVPDTLAILGKDSTLARIEHCISNAQK